METTTKTFWFGIVSPKEISLGDELIIAKPTNRHNIEVLAADVLDKKLGLGIGLTEAQHVADVLKLNREESFFIQQELGSSSIPRLPKDTRIIRVTELTPSGFYAEVVY